MADDWGLGKTLQEDVETYCGFGEHRTGSEADLRTVSWLKTRLRDLGYDTLRQPFPVRQFFPRKSWVDAGDGRIAAFPLWFPQPTGRAPLAGKLRAFPSDDFSHGDIALIRLAHQRGGAMMAEHEDAVLDAADGGAAAVVAIAEHPTGEIVAFNAPGDPRPWPMPVLLAGERDAQRLDAAAAEGRAVSLLLDGDWKTVAAKNIVGRREGDGPLLVVSTPVSGWFRCGGERGPGVALWLALAEWAVKENLPAVFVGTSGHELGMRGMSAFLHEQAPRPDDVDCWLHLGAGVAAWDWVDGADGELEQVKHSDSRRLLMTSDDLANVIPPVLAGEPGLEPVTGQAVGEMGQVLARGYRSFGIAGAHRHFHTPADGPQMTGPELLEPMAKLLVAAIDAALE